MACEEGSMLQYTNKSVEAAAATGQEGPEGCSVVAEETGSSKKKAGAAAVAQDTAAVADGEDDPTEMSWTDFVVANKRLPQEEIGFILSRQLQPFESTNKFQEMVAGGSATTEDLQRAAADHQWENDTRSELQDRVRKELAENSFVRVDDDAIARRLEFDAYLKKAWSTMISELDLHDSDFADELGDYDDDDDGFFNNEEENAGVDIALY
ncbi:hypothetical protein BS78_04G185500 [Paspalum vaginatum]|nr:hypothetical protein BS78_04G185500 [Paspalum vaginatum]